jgi:predicted Zn-dependent peptidase
MKSCFIPFRGLMSTTIHLKVRAGSNFEAADEIGVAHMLEHMVLSKTRRFGSQAEAMRYLAEVGGRFVAVTSRESVLFMTKVLNTEVDRGLDLLHDVFCNAVLTEENLEIQKRVVAHEISRYKDMPEKMIGRVSNRIMFPGHRMALLNTGSIEDVEKITLDKLQRFYEEKYNASNFVLCVCGDLNEDELLERIQNQWGNIKTGEFADYAPIEYAQGLRTQAFLNENYTRCQLQISFPGFTVFDKSYMVARFLAYLFNSYANTVIKNKLGLAYKIACHSASNGKYGTFSFTVGCKEDSVKRIIDEYKYMLQNAAKLLKNEGIGIIRNKIRADMIFAYEKPSVRAEYYSENLVMGNSDVSWEKELDSVSKVNTTDVVGVSESLLDQDPKITIFANTLNAERLKMFWQD